MMEPGLGERAVDETGEITICQAIFRIVFKHLTHRYRRRGTPSSITTLRWMFNFHRRFVCTIEWLTLCPN